MATTQVIVVTAVILSFLMGTNFADHKFSINKMHPQCSEYKKKDIRKAGKMAETKSFIGANVNCIDNWEINCLGVYKLFLSDEKGKCKLLGEECGKKRKDIECRVRANLIKWNQEKRLVGECFCYKKCPPKHLKSPKHTKSPNHIKSLKHVKYLKERGCVHAGKLLCSCMAEGKKLKYALFGGYTCDEECNTNCTVAQRMQQCVVPHFNAAEIPAIGSTGINVLAPRCNNNDDDNNCMETFSESSPREETISNNSLYNEPWRRNRWE